MGFRNLQEKLEKVFEILFCNLDICFPLQHYEKFHSGLSRREYPCSSCRYNYQDLRSLKGHCKKKHEKEIELPFACNVCDLTFILEEALLFHLKTEHAQKIDTLNCADCSLEFFSKGRESERLSSEKSAIFVYKLALWAHIIC